MNGLEQVFGRGSIIGQQLGLQAFNQQQDNQALEGAGALQKMFQAEQMNPLKLAEQGHINNQYEALLPGHQADSSMKVRKNSLEEEFMPQERVAKQSGYDTKLSEDQVSQIKNFAQKLAFHPDPKMRELGASILENDADVIRDKSKQKYMGDRQMELARLNGSIQGGLLDRQIAAGRFADHSGGGKGPTGDLVTDLTAELAKQKKASEKHNTLIDYSNRAANAGNLELAGELMRRAEALRPQALAELRAVAAPNKAALGELGIQATPDINIAPAQQTAPAAPKQYTPGQTYTGKTGTYQYVGGDPKNPQSWKKVN